MVENKDNPVRSDARFQIKDDLVRLTSPLPHTTLGDLSRTGLFLHTKNSDILDIGDQLSFGLEFSLVTLKKNISLKAEIMRKTPVGLGLRLIFDGEAQQNEWLSAIVEYEKYLKKAKSSQWRVSLPQPVALEIRSGEGSVKGMMKEVGDEYALVAAANINLQEPVELVFPQQRIRAQAVSFSVSGYLFQFTQLTAEQKQFVQALISSSYAIEDQLAGPEIRKLEVTPEKFVDMHERYISQGVFLIEEGQQLQIGQEVSISLVVKRGRKVPFKLAIKGSVVRKASMNQKVIKIDQTIGSVLPRAQKMAAELQDSTMLKRDLAQQRAMMLQQGMMLAVLAVAIFFGAKLVSRVIQSAQAPASDPEDGLTVEQIVKFKFVNQLNLEETKVSVPSDPSTSFPLADVFMVKFDPVSGKYSIVLKDRREIEMTLALFDLLPDRLQTIIKTLNPGDSFFEPASAQ